MRRVPLVISLLALMLALLACGGTQTPTTEQEQTPIEVTRLVEGTPIIETVIVTATPEPAKGLKAPDTSTYINATIGDPETFDPALSYETSGGNIIQNTYETLVTFNRENPAEVVPQLATEWKISDDGLSYTFTIREGVTFHEGQELSAEDVAFTFQRGLLQGGPDSPQLLFTEPLLGIGIYDVVELIDPALTGDIEALKKVDKAQLAGVCEQIMEAIKVSEDGKGVTFTLKQPYAPFLVTLAGQWGSVVDQEWIAENGGWDGDCATWQDFYGVVSENDPFTPIINGTGPYKLERWTPGEEVVLIANENYWRTEEVGPAWEDGPIGPPAIERIIIQTVEEWGTRFAMMQAGDVDEIVVPRENVTQIDPSVGERCEYDAATLGFKCAPTDNPDGPLRLFLGQPSVSRTDAMFVFNINTEGGNNFLGSGQLDGNGIPPDFFTDIHVRKGFNYCFDWDVYIADALNGEAVKNVGFIIPGLVGYDESGPTYSYDPDKCAEELATAWEGKLPETGFRLQVAYNTGNVTRQTIAEIIQANLAAVNEKYVVETIGLPWPTFLRTIRESRLPLYISAWVQDIPDPHNWAQPFLVGTYARRQNFPEELTAEFKALVDEAVSLTDPEARAEVYRELGQLDYDNAVAIRLAVPTGRRYEQRWVQGYFYNSAPPGTNYYILSKQ